MLFRFRVPVLLGHSKVNNVNNISRFGVRSTDEEVVWLDVSIDKVLFVYCLYSRKLVRSVRNHQNSTCHSHHLFRDHDDSFDREFPVAVVEQIFQAGAQQINNQYVV